MGQKKFGVIGDGFEEEGHAGMEPVAGGDEQEAVGFLLRIGRWGLALEKGSDGLLVDGEVVVDETLAGFVEQFGLGVALGRGYDADGVESAGIHETECAEAVEPGVGDAFDDLFFRRSSDGLSEFDESTGASAKVGGIGREDVAEPVGHAGIEIGAGLAGKGFEVLVGHALQGVKKAGISDKFSLC